MKSTLRTLFFAFIALAMIAHSHLALARIWFVAPGAPVVNLAPGQDPASLPSSWNNPLRLWEAILYAAPNDTILMKSGDYNESDNPPSGFSSYRISKNLTIKGGLLGIVGTESLDLNFPFSRIYPPCQRRILAIANCSVYLHNLIFTGGNASSEVSYSLAGKTIPATYGGAVCCAANANVSFHNTSFLQNVSSSSGYGFGGALVIMDSEKANDVSNDVITVNVSFSGNTVFEANAAGKYLSNSDFISRGGAIYVAPHCSLSFAGNVTFKDNIACAATNGNGGQGGAIFLGSATKVSFNDASSLNFLENIACAGNGTGEGGAIWSEAVLDFPVAANASFIGNRASFGGNGQGGAICVFANRFQTQNSLLYFRNVTFQDNIAVSNSSSSASAKGGAIYLSGSNYFPPLPSPSRLYLNAILYLSHGSSLSRNVASKGIASDVKGGAVYIDNANAYRGNASQLVLQDAAIFDNIASDNPDAQRAIYNGGGVYATNDIGLALPDDNVPRIYDNLPSTLPDPAYAGEYNVFPDITRTIAFDPSKKQLFDIAFGELSAQTELLSLDLPPNVPFPSFFLSPLPGNSLTRPIVKVYPFNQRFNIPNLLALASLASSSSSDQSVARYDYDAPLSQDIFLWPNIPFVIVFEKSNTVSFSPDYPSSHPDGVSLSLGDSLDFSIFIPAAYTHLTSHFAVFKDGILQRELSPRSQTSSPQGTTFYFRFYFNLLNAANVSIKHFFDCLTVQLPPLNDPAFGSLHVLYPSSADFPGQPAPEQTYYLPSGSLFSFVAKHTSPSPPAFFQLLLNDFHTLAQRDSLGNNLYRFSFHIPDWHLTNLQPTALLNLKFLESDDPECLASPFFQKNPLPNPPFFTLTLPRFPQGFTLPYDYVLGDIRPPENNSDTTFFFAPYPQGHASAELTFLLPLNSPLPHLSANLVPLDPLMTHSQEGDKYTYSLSFKNNTLLLPAHNQRRTVYLPKLPDRDAPFLLYRDASPNKQGYYTANIGQTSLHFGFAWDNIRPMKSFLPQIISARWDDGLLRVTQDTALPLSLENHSLLINTDALLHFRTPPHFICSFPQLPQGAAYAQNLSPGNAIYPLTDKNTVDTFAITTSGPLRYITPIPSISPIPATLSFIKRDDNQNSFTYWFEFSAKQSVSISIDYPYHSIKLPTPEQLPDNVRYAGENQLGGEYRHSSDHPFSFLLDLADMPSDKSIRIVFFRDNSSVRDTISPVLRYDKVFSFSLPEVTSGAFDIRFSADTLFMPDVLPEALTYDPSSKLKAGKYIYPVGGAFLDTLVLNLAFSHLGLRPLVMVNDLMCEPYEVVGGMMFRYKISAQGGDASVKIALPFFVVSLLTDGKPESINFADTPNGGVFYCIPGSSFSFDLIVAESADGNIPSVASTGSQTPRLVGKVADRRFRYVIDELSGPAAISISGVISGQVIIPLPAQLPQGLSFFAGKEGEAFLSGGTYTFPVMQSVNDSFALLLNKKYRRIEPSVSISSGSLDTLITSDSTRVYHINTSFSQEKDYKVYLSIAFPPLSSILLPSTPQGAAYINGFEPGIWYCTAHSDSLFSFDIQLNEFYKHARLSLLRGETSFLPVPVDGALRYTLSGEENINDLSFKMEFHSLTIPSNIPTGLSYRTGNAVGGQPFLTPGNYIFSPQQTKSLFAIEVDLEQVVVDATPLVTITTGNSTVPIVPDSSAVSGDNRKTYFFSCLTQGHASSLINVSIPFYRITLNPIPPQFANMLAFANGSEPEIGELLAGERYEFYLRLKAPYTEADIIVDIDGDTLVPKPQGNHIYHFSFIANNNVTPTIGLRYASVSLSPPPPNVFYIGSRSNLSPLYHQYDDWKDSFSIKLLPEYAFVLPLVKTSNNTILQHASFNGDTYTYTYVFSGSGDMNVSVSLPYKTVSFPPLPQGIAYIPPISHGNFFFSANREFSFSLQTTEAFSNAVPLVKAEQLTLADEDTDPHDRIYRYSVTLAETDLALSISLKYRQLSYLPIDPPVRAFIKYDPALRDSGVYRFSPNIATHIDTFALIRDEANIANLPFSFSVAASNGVTVQEVDGKPLTYAVLSTDDTEISVSVNKLTVSLPQLPSGLVYDQPPSYSLSDYPKQPGSYSLYPSQRFSFTLRPTDNYASLIPAVSVNGNSLPPAVYSGNKYEYSFSVTANASPLITMPFVSCSLPSLPEGFTYASGGSNKTAGLWPHATGIPFRDTFEIVIAPGFANVQYVIIASTPSVPETKLSPIPGSNRYVVSGNGTENITVTLSAPYHTIILPGLSSTPQLHYAEGSPADNAIHRHPPGVMFSFTIQRDAGVRATPTATLAGVNVTCTEIATDVFRFSFTLPQEADQTLTYSPLITLPPVFTLTLPSLLPQGVHYASDSLAAGVHLFPQDADLSFVLQTDPGLDGINPVVTKDNGSRVERIDLGENKNRYNCGKNQNVEIKSIEMNFFTVIINPPPEGVLVAPPAAIYNRHTDLSFTFTMTTPVLPPLTSLVVESNGVVLAPEILETGGLYFTISASAPHDTFHVSSKLQSTVSNQPSLVHGKTPVVAYKDACLLISGLNGCHLSLISLTGVTIARFSTTEQVTPSLVPEADYWLYPLTLPSGVYILYAEKERNRPLTLKFVVP